MTRLTRRDSLDLAALLLATALYFWVILGVAPRIYTYLDGLLSERAVPTIGEF